MGRRTTIIKRSNRNKKSSLRNHHQSTTTAKSALLKFELRASEKVKDVFNKEHANFCTIIVDTKKQVSNFLSKFIQQASNWEVTTSKYELATTLFKMQIKFNRSLIAIMLINDKISRKFITKINYKAYKIAKCIIEKQLLNNTTKILEYIELEQLEAIRI